MDTLESIANSAKSGRHERPVDLTNRMKDMARTGKKSVATTEETRTP